MNSPPLHNGGMTRRDLVQDHLKPPYWDCPKNLVYSLQGICPQRVRDTLQGISQWGLKEFWIAQGIDSHDRWEHSKGVLAVTALWLEKLDGSAQANNGAASGSRRLLAKVAALLHDFGHLPFAHLLADVLESMSWVPTRGGHAGLEGFVLTERLGHDSLGSHWAALATKLKLGSADAAKQAVLDLILGRFGIPWLQVIVNSPVDADKIDYIARDTEFLGKAGWHTSSRLATVSAKWLESFLSDQQVSPTGLLCFNGRSAVAAADLLRERIFLYDRFYLSPELRVCERMAFEIVQQFLIRAVMSDAFRQNLGGVGGTRGYRERCKAEHQAADPAEMKCRLVAELLESLAPQKTGGPDRELELLDFMWERLSEDAWLDNDYKGFLQKCYDTLRAAANGKVDIGSVVEHSLIRAPLVFHRQDHAKVRDALRPVQHRYCREVLIDVVRLPRVLGAPARWRFDPDPDAPSEVDYGILVPEGGVSAWGPGSKARVPLNDQAVGELERPYGRVIVIAPDQANSARSEYIWDRVRSALLEAGVKPLSVAEVNGKGVV
jgi:HD superfamily phosphohydrolase